MIKFYPQATKPQSFKIPLLRKSLLVLLMSFFSVSVFAATITSTSTGGNWDVGTTWVGGIVPSAGDDVIIADGATVTVGVSAGTKTVSNLVIGLGSSLFMNGNSLSITNTLSINSGGILDMGTGVLTVGGSLSNNGGTVKTANTSSTPLPTGRTWGGVVMYNAATGGQTVVVGTYNDLTIDNASGITSAGGNLIINGNLVTSATTTFNLVEFTLGGTFGASGSAGNVRTQRLTAAFAGKTWGGTVTFDATATGNTNKQFVQPGNYTNLTLRGGDKDFNTGIVYISGVFDPAGIGAVTVSPDATIAFSGTGAQNIPTFPYHYLYIGVFSDLNNGGTMTTLPGTIGDKTLSGNITVSGELGMFNGIIKTAGNTFTMLTGSTLNSGAGSGSTKSYVDGAMIKMGAADFKFPLGKSGVFAPLTLNLSTSFVQTFTAEYFRGNARAMGPVQSPLTRVSACEYWKLDRGAVAPGETLDNPLVTLAYSAQSPCGSGGNYANDGSTLRVAHLDNLSGTLTWRNASGNLTGTGNNAGTVSSDAAYTGDDDEIGFLTLGTTEIGGAANVLPVKFTSITATQKAGGVEVVWKTATEENVSHYEVERSTTGTSFTTVAQTRATVNGGGAASYAALDATALTGTTFYRVKGVDIDGKLTYSSIVRLSPNGLNSGAITLYPNPVKGSTINLQSSGLEKGVYQVAIFDVTGRRVHAETVNHTGGAISQPLQLPASLKAGTYSLQLIGNSNRTSQTFVIQ